MGYLLEFGPRDGEYVDDIPEGYVPRGITSGVVESPSDSPPQRAVWQADLDEMNRVIHNQQYKTESDADDLA
jgi:hypothetical protein